MLIRRGAGVNLVIKEPVWLALVLGWLLLMGVLTPLVDRSDLAQICMWMGGTFCLNLAVVSLCVPWLQRRFG